MGDSQGKFVWYELVTSDVAAAEAFYGKVVGWDAQAFDRSGGPYKILSMKGKGVGGLMKLPAGMSEPFWLGYVGTPDIDAAVARLKDAGGSATACSTSGTSGVSHSSPIRRASASR